MFDACYLLLHFKLKTLSKEKFKIFSLKVPEKQVDVFVSSVKKDFTIA